MTVIMRIPNISPQRIFDTVVRHLHMQGRRAANANGVCMYRTEEGLRCAVGCLISDYDYVPTMEGNLCILFENFRNRPSIAPLCKHFALLLWLVSAHDSARNWTSRSRMRQALQEVAATFKLRTNVVDECFPSEDEK